MERREEEGRVEGRMEGRKNKRKTWRRREGRGRKKRDHLYPRAIKNLTSVCMENFEDTEEEKAIWYV